MSLKNLPIIELSENQIIWLKETWNQLLSTGKKVNYKSIRINTRMNTGEDFNPHLINSKLIRDHATNITFLGLLCIEPETEMLKIINLVLNHMKHKLLENPDDREFRVKNIAIDLALEEKLVGLCFNFISDIDNFYNQAGRTHEHNEIWQEYYVITEQNTFDNLMNFTCIEDCINKKYEKKISDTLDPITNEEKDHENEVFWIDSSGNLHYNEELLVQNVKKTGFINSKVFVNEKRLLELESIRSKSFDLLKLTSLCKELNVNYSFENYYSVAMLTRAIIDHIPPIFSYESFRDFVNSYNSEKNAKSFKKQMIHLNNSLRNIGDSCIHSQIRKSEVLPNDTQIDFKNDLDVLLAEIVRVLKTN